MNHHTLTSPLKRGRGNHEDEADEGSSAGHGAHLHTRVTGDGTSPGGAPASGHGLHIDPAVSTTAVTDRSSRYATSVSQAGGNEEDEEGGRGGGGARRLYDAAEDALERASAHSAVFTQSTSATSRSRASSHSSRATPPPPLPYAAPASSSSASSSYSDEDVEDETNERDPRNHAEDVAKKYPMFTEAYAEKFRRDATPFMRVVEVPASMPRTSSSARMPEGSAPSSPIGSVAMSGAVPHREKHFVLYDTYLYERTLGKGTFSKVVLGTASPSSPALTNQISGDVPARVALKVFRDKEEYIEACWDEFTILNSICVDPPTVTPEEAAAAVTAAAASSGSGSGGGHRHSSISVAAMPSPYISIRSVAMFTASTCGIKQQYFADQGRFLVPMGYVAHPVHPAIVFPVMGPTLLNVLNTIRQKSKEVTRASRHKRARTESTADKTAVATSSGSVSATVTATLVAAAARIGVVSSGDGATASPSVVMPRAPHLQPQRRVYYRGLPLPLLKAVLYQMLTFLQFIHCRGVVHTDLKPENVLFESSTVLSVDVGIYYTHYAPRGGPDSAATSFMTQTKKRSNDSFKFHSSSLEQRAHRDEQSVPYGMRIATTPGAAAAAAAAGGAGGSDRGETSPLTSGRATAAGLSTVPIDIIPAHKGDVTLAHYVRVPMPVMNSVRVVDLGAAQFLSTFRDHSLIPGYSHVPVSYNPIQTSHYRSPEVLLGFGWSTSADIFSLGCMIPELLTGECLFMPNHTMEHLAMMQHVIGAFHDKDGIRSGTTSNLRSVFACNMRTFRHYFTLQPNNRDFDLKWPVSKSAVQEQAKQQRFAPSSTSGKAAEEEGLEALEETLLEDIDYVTHKPTLSEILAPLPDLLDLTRRMLHYHPFKRITAEEAMQHPFFRNM